METMQKLTQERVEFAANMFKLLGHPLRLRIVELLDLNGEMTVTEIQTATDEPQSTVSIYLNRMKTVGLLTSRRDGNQSYYTLAEPKLRTLLDCLRGCPLDD